MAATGSRSKKIFSYAIAILVLAVLAFFSVLPRVVDARLNRVEPSANIQVSPRARELHARLRVADLHDDVLLWPRDIRDRYDRGHTDLARMIEGNVTLQVFGAVTHTPRGLNFQRNTDETDQTRLLAIASLWPVSTWTNVMQRALYISQRFADARDEGEGRLLAAKTKLELESALAERSRKRNRVIGVLALEGLHMLEGRIESLDRLFEAGYRMGGLAHFFDNEVAGSAHGVRKHGLTRFGRLVVSRMNALGMIVDLAHASPRTISDVLRLTRKPPIVSHTGVSATCPGPRNLTDEQIRGIAAKRGLIGIGFFEGAVCDATPRGIARAIVHTGRVGGFEHVALGSDFDGAVAVPFDIARLDQLTQALLDSGLNERQIRAVMGENAIRFLNEQLP